MSVPITEINCLTVDYLLLGQHLDTHSFYFNYHPTLQELYTWDRGNQLTYPIRYHVNDYNSTVADKTEDALNPQMQTGYEIFHDHDNGNDAGR